MRSLALLELFASITTTSCGPSAAELRLAKSAVYDDSPQSVFARAVAATLHKHYEIGIVDCKRLVFTTRRRLYLSDGSALTPATPQNMLRENGPGVAVVFGVEITPTTGDRATVVVRPRAWVGGAFGREVDADDPTMPGFIVDRADALSLEIHDYEARRADAADGCAVATASARTPDGPQDFIPHD